MLNSIYMYVAAGAIAVALLVLYWLKSRQSSNKTESDKGEETVTAPSYSSFILKEEILDKAETGEVNALVHDVARRAFGLRYVKLVPGRNYGRQWHYDNRLVYWLSLKENKELVPIVPAETLEHSPGELYEALQTKDDTLTVFGPQATNIDKIKIGLLILGACVALFLMYLAIKGG